MLLIKEKKPFFLLIFLVFTILFFSSSVNADLDGAKDLLQYGDMWFHVDDVLIIDLTSIGQYATINFSNSTFTKGVIFDNNGTLTVEKEGIYKVDYSASFGSSGSNAEFELAVGIDGVEQNNTNTHRKLGTGGDVGNDGGTALLRLLVGENISLMIRDNKAPVQDPEFISASLVIIRIDTTEEFTEKEKFFWLYLGMIALSFGLLGLWAWLDDKWFGLLSGILLTITGIVFARLGFPEFTNAMGRLSVIVVLTGLGLYIVLYMAYKLVTEEGFP